MRWRRAAIRGSLGAVLIMVAVLLLVPGRSEPPGRGPLTLATAGDLTEYLGPLLQDWNREHPDERVTVIELPDAADETRAQMITELRSGSERFDVLNMDVVWTAEFAAAGWIRPLDQDGYELDAFLPPVVDTATYDGQLYAVPYVTNAGLLYYRADLLRQAGEEPPRTWAELERLARTVAPRHGVDGYAGQFLPYEGLTVNAAEAVRSAGGSFLDEGGTEVTVDSAAARRGLGFLAEGVREGWIAPQALSYTEEDSRRAFQEGRLLFLRNWPYVYELANAPGSAVAGEVAVVPLPGPDGPGTGVLGGSNLAISSHSRYPESAADLIRYLTSEPVQRRVLTDGSLPPVRAALYSDPGLIAEHPYLPTLRRAVLAAEPRPESPRYDQVTLAVQAAVHDVLALRQTPDEAVGRLAEELRAIAHRD